MPRNHDDLAVGQQWVASAALLPALPGASRVGLRSPPTGLLRQPGGKV
ncbi:hypothetical protein ACQP2U_07710 [Nocardia sp. CA-084685]